MSQLAFVFYVQVSVTCSCLTGVWYNVFNSFISYGETDNILWNWVFTLESQINGYL